MTWLDGELRILKYSASIHHFTFNFTIPKEFPFSMKKYLLVYLLLPVYCFSQETPATNDSSQLLEEVVVTPFELLRTNKLTCGVTVKTVQTNNADRYNKSSLVTAFNTVAGVRMEERSPGSYRINIRGSSLRSPFGVRNVKVYWNDIPFTDPGGNTYFNQLAQNNFSSIDVVKGPAGSMYGAGTGGLILIRNLENDWKPSISLEYITGSYGLNNILAGAGWGDKKNKNQFTYSHTESKGFRDHTRMRKDNASFLTKWKISDKQQLSASILYTDLFYETPGGLNINEFNANAKQARPAAGGFPSANAAKAGIHQKNFLAGINHQYQFNNAFKNSTILYGAFAQVRNPTFRNYERRTEPHFGGRTTFTYSKKINKTRLQFIAGGELQEGFFNTQVSKNKNGNPDTIQTNDDIRYTTFAIFLQGDININEKWFLTAGASVNQSKVQFTRLSSYPVLQQARTYKNEIAPRVSLLRKIANNHTVFATVAKGFSPPTIAELLPSTGVISTFLEAEQGTNYELGGRSNLLKGKLQLELVGYYFKLNNALVARKDNANADYFVNAGNTKQQGMELSADFSQTYNNKTVDYFNIMAAYAYNNYKYGSFKKATTDFSGKTLPGIPPHTISILADIHFTNGLYFNSTYYQAGAIYLDDGNSVKASAYQLLGARVGWNKKFIKKQHTLNIYIGADNLLDKQYSLGNDINAAGGRFYNLAPKRNFYIGIKFDKRHIPF
jgi:iron complex outermembrane recepter protein